MTNSIGTDEKCKVPCSGCPLPGAKENAATSFSISDFHLLSILLISKIPSIYLIAPSELLRNPHDCCGLAISSSHWSSLLHVAQILRWLLLPPCISSCSARLPSRGLYLFLFVFVFVSVSEFVFVFVFVFGFVFFFRGPTHSHVHFSGVERDSKDLPGEWGETRTD